MLKIRIRGSEILLAFCCIYASTYTDYLLGTMTLVDVISEESWITGVGAEDEITFTSWLLGNPTQQAR